MTSGDTHERRRARLLADAQALVDYVRRLKRGPLPFVPRARIWLRVWALYFRARAYGLDGSGIAAIRKFTERL